MESFLIVDRNINASEYCNHYLTVLRGSNHYALGTCLSLPVPNWFQVDLFNLKLNDSWLFWSLSNWNYSNVWFMQWCHRTGHYGLFGYTVTSNGDYKLKSSIFQIFSNDKFPKIVSFWAYAVPVKFL